MSIDQPARRPRQPLSRTCALGVGTFSANHQVTRAEGVLDRQPDPALSAALRRAHDAGARIAALCTRAFVLAAAARPAGGRPGAALDWARAHLDKPLTVQDLARQSGLSARQLARRMRAEVGLTPLRWLHQQRITRAQDLLERTEASVEQIAARCGLGTATTLRRRFHQTAGVSPTAYRTAFRS
jgi:transcriptional regulator GlxA family with amidase domain